MTASYDAATLEMLSAHAGEWSENLLGRLDPDGSLAHVIMRQLAAYTDPNEYAGRRLLDFGCGVGASSLALARFLPKTSVIGVELNAEQVRLGNRLAAEMGMSNLRFVASPAGDQLPADIGTFDIITLCCVYEHLLPLERRRILPLLWRALKPGGLFLLNGTPYRWFPIEHHTTGLPLLNYLPNRLAHALAQQFGKYPHKGNWSTYLRAGIRGGTEWSVRREIGGGEVLQPRTGDRASYWLEGTSPHRRGLKRLIAAGFRATDHFFHTIPSTHLEVALRKPL